MFGGPVREAKSPADLVRLLDEVGAYSATLLAGVGVGSVAEACSVCINIMGSTQPDASDVEAYHRSYAVYQGLYPALKSGFEKMGETG